MAILHDHPEATRFAGGTYLMSKQRGARMPRLAATIVSLARMEEMKRIARSERYIDIGATASIASVLQIGSNIVPEILATALRSIGYRPIRNQATLGGNICVPEARLTAFPVLLLLDAQVELRRENRSKWISLSRFIHADGTLNLEADEICTRIRIPRGEWNIQIYRNSQVGTIPTNWGLSFCGIADTRKGVLTDFRFAFGSMGKTLIRDREIEAELISRKLPLGNREIEFALNQLEMAIEAITPGPSDIQRRSILRYFSWFLRCLYTE
jgi:CO/xanthine dehydrogenase FAD-binding subunit